MIDPAARLRIGLVTPWPPQPSGIADYACDLCADLRDAGALPTVFVRPEEEAPRGLEGVEIVDVTAPGRAAEGFAVQDVLLYQLGNSPRFHGWMLPLIEKHGGVVHLHDMVLHHLVAALTDGEHSDAAYLGTVARWCGDKAARWAARGILEGPVPWHTRHVTDLPLAEEILRFASACVVHSDYVYARLAPRLPRLPFLKLRQRLRMPRPPRPARDPSTPFSAAVLGDVVPNKQVDMVVRAVAEARRGGAAVELDIVGEADLAIRDLVRTLGLADAVRVHGRVGQDAFVAALARADLCIVWRDPTMGETSGVASRALQIGVPLVVHRIGWYGELPDPVVKLDGHDAERSLAQLLHRLATDPASHARLVHEAGVLADTLAAQDRTIEDLLAFLRSVASGAELLDEVGLARTASVLAAVGVTTDPEDAVLRRQALDRVGPVIGYVTAPDPFRDVPLFSAGG